MSESPNSILRKDLPKVKTPDDDLREQFEQRRQDITVPESLARKVVEGINFALISGAAKAIDGYDLYHVHVCIPQGKVDWKSSDYGGWEGDSKLVLENLAADPDTVLLFHSQEFVNHPTKNRNIVIEGRYGRPRIIPSIKGIEGISPNDLKTFSPLDLRFLPTPEGPYTLDNGTKIDIFLYEFGKK